MRGKRAREIRRAAAKLRTPYQRVSVYRALKRWYVRNRGKRVRGFHTGGVIFL